jgi:hypothetical protein
MIVSMTSDQGGLQGMLIEMSKMDLIGSALISVNSLMQRVMMFVVVMGILWLSAWMIVKKILTIPSYAGALKGVPIGMIIMILMAVKRVVHVKGVIIGQSLLVTLIATIITNLFTLSKVIIK